MAPNRLVDVFLPRRGGRLWTYRLPDEIPDREAAPGRFVEVPFGKRHALGLLTSAVREAGLGDPSPERLRDLAGIAAEGELGSALWRSLEWVARYHLQPVTRALDELAPWPGLELEAVPDGAPWLRQIARPRAPIRIAACGDTPPPGIRAGAREVWARLLRDGPLTAEEISAHVRDASGLIRRWCERGFARRLEDSVQHDQTTPNTPGPAPAPITLTPEQHGCDEKLAAWQTTGGRLALLEGITGSGKTELYATAAIRALERGWQVLILVPEISLAGPIARRIAERTGAETHVWHSAMAHAPRRATRIALASGRPLVLVGPRSAIFAPMPRLGLIIVDEEHDPAYANSDGFGAHARDTAIQRGRFAGAPVLLGSATPSLEVAKLARRGEVLWVRLANRPGSVQLPDVEIVDVELPHNRGPLPWLSKPLFSALAETLARGEQAVLFRNRRGFHPTILCSNCRETQQCPECSADLVLHSRPRELRCHLCGLREPWVERCQHCGSEGGMKAIGTGTQRAEHELAALFPEARIDRLDRDVLTSAGRIERILDDLNAGRTDILIGTQLVTKGLDVERVTLVGVLAADGALHLPDFRAAERVFQQLYQVSGRAGRGRHPGRVLIQSSQPDHPVIEAVRLQDYSRFVERELVMRERAGMPPHRRLVRAIWSHPDPERAARGAAEAVRAAGSVSIRVLGPAPCPLERLQGRWRWHAFALAGDFGPIRDWARRLQRLGDAELNLRIEVDPQQIN